MADSNIQTLDTVKPITLDEYEERTAHLQENTTSLLSTIEDRQVQAAGLATQAYSLASEVNAVAEQASLSFSKKTWKDTATSGTPITAAELNRLENAISNLTTAVNNLQDSVSPKYTSKTVGVPGWAGEVTTTLLSSNTLGIYAYIYTAILGGAPWQNAVQPSVNPAGSDVWYINLGKACVSVGANMRKFNNICNLQAYDTGYYATYGGALNPTFWIGADNMYAQVGPQAVWTNGPAVLRISAVLRI